ncbi:M23 family metallopeptidase [bacterium]|nr:M23 family metallopeptidase [bacterium]
MRKKISTKFKNRYRLIIRTDEDLEARVSIVLTPLNTLLVLSALIALFGTVVILLLSYTPMSNILPTTADHFTHKERLQLIRRVDSLETLSRQRDFQAQRLSEILKGVSTEDGVEVAATPAAPQESNGTSTSGKASLNPIKASYTFYPPLKGTISDTFNMERKHFAVDIAAKRKDVVKACQKGTVIFSAWNPESGYTMVIQHPNDFLSVYKHNAVLLKKEGNFVNAGDAIALVGSTGELSSGPHLHFELWNKGIALNPSKYISF